MTELHELLEVVEDKKSFLKFVRALIADREGEVEKENSSFIMNRLALVKHMPPI